jgi:hypothetical protein
MFSNRHDFRGIAGTPGASDGTLCAISLLEKNTDVLTDTIISSLGKFKKIGMIIKVQQSL